MARGGGDPGAAKPSHRYALEDFGLTSEQVDERFEVGRCVTFGGHDVEIIKRDSKNPGGDVAKTAVQATQNPKLLEAFNEMGWGNHPELIKAFAFFGKMMRDSGSEVGSPGGTEQPKKPWERRPASRWATARP